MNNLFQEITNLQMDKITFNPANNEKEKSPVKFLDLVQTLHLDHFAQAKFPKPLGSTIDF